MNTNQYTPMTKKVFVVVEAKTNLRFDRITTFTGAN